jgi:hypothetical protein
MPMRFGRALVLAGIGGVATFLCWSALWTLFWGPYWQLLNRNGMYVHDIEATYLIVFGPIVVALSFLITACIEAFVEKRRFASGQNAPGNRWRIAFFGVLPGAIVFLLVSGSHGDAWHFPLSEATVCLIGLGLGYLWARWRRMDEVISSEA